MAFLIVLGILLAAAMFTAAHQTFRYDFSEPPITPEPDWKIDRTALAEATNGKRD